jgi:archaeal flagellar protein FlaJ
MVSKESPFFSIRQIISVEESLLKELENLQKSIDSSKSEEDKKKFEFQIKKIKEHFNKINSDLNENLDKIRRKSALPQNKLNISNKTQSSPERRKGSLLRRISLRKAKKKFERDELKKITLKRLKKRKEKVKKVAEKKPSKYLEISNRFFSNFSRRMLEKGNFETLRRDLMKTNIQMLAKSYISMMLFSTFISVFAGILLFLFFLFFNISPLLPIIIPVETDFFLRFFQVIWIVPLIPFLTFIFMYFYPGMEKQSLRSKIDQEVPFATIHMSSISGSMIDPSKIFSVIVSTHEYPNIEKEFIKILNEVNILGYDLITALRHIAFNCPSKKLSELLNGLATTITSGGDISDFFEKRSQSLLFEYRIEREKETKSSETFMDIYISTVIAAPMILMLLLVIMKISGLGIELSTTMISVIMVLGVSVANFFFLIFLHLKGRSI